MASSGRPGLMDDRAASDDRDAPPVRLRATAVIAAWTAPALLSTFQRWASDALTSHPASFWRIAAAEWPGWYLWAAMTPPIFYLAARYPMRRATRLRDVAKHAGAWAVCSLLHALIRSRDYDAATASTSFARYVGMTSIAWMPSTFLLYVVTVGAALWMRALAHAQQRERERTAMSVELARAELNALRSQLHPHFLFNTLNTIAILIRERETEVSARLVTQLGDVLRHVLRGTRANVAPLADEIALVATYLEIEQVRFGDRLSVSWSVEDDTLAAEVPSLVLQPLVENALRHGIARRTTPGSMEIGARREEDELVLWVVDDGPSTAASSVAAISHESGVGLRNTRERLARLYPRKSSLLLHPVAGGGTRAEVRQPFRRMTAS